MNKSTQPDTSSQIADRPRYAELTPDEERAFFQKLAELEAAFRQTGDPLSLWEALDLVERSGQTVPYWLPQAFFRAIMQPMTDNEIKRARERWWAARRYKVVCDLRQTGYSQKGYSKERAIDQAVIELRAEGDKGVQRRGKLDEGVSRDTVERSYDKVKKDLERRGRESQYYYLVNKMR
jgi:hypothetical protein